MQVRTKNYIRTSKDAEELAQIIFHKTKEELFLHDRIYTSLFRFIKFRYYLHKLEKGLPLEYAIKSAEFMDNDFYVNEDVLIPRPETEMLVRAADRMIGKRKNLNILEIGCGSGALIISVATRHPHNTYLASDISSAALAVARKNSRRLSTDIKLIKSDLLKNISVNPDVILSNLPYLADSQVTSLHDPKIALISPKHDSYLIEKLLNQCTKLSNCSIILEIGHNQGRLKDYAKRLFPQALIRIEKDFNNYDRLLTIETPHQE